METCSSIEEAGSEFEYTARKCVIFRAFSASNLKQLNLIIQNLKDEEKTKINSLIEKTRIYTNRLKCYSLDCWFDAINSKEKIEKHISYNQGFISDIRKSLNTIVTSDDSDRVNTNLQKDLKKIRKLLKQKLNTTSSPELKDSISNLISIITEKEGNKERFINLLEKQFMNKIIKEDDLEYGQGEKLGTGGFGTVCGAHILSTSEYVAVKEIRSDKISPNTWVSIFNEVEALDALAGCKYILQLVGVHIKEPFRIITRYCKGKSLFERLHKNGNGRDTRDLDPTICTRIAYQIAYGMNNIHEKGYIHCDLKTLNVLLDDNDNVCIADFGLVQKQSTEYKVLYGGTYNYSAPEILVSIPYTKKIDVYSYGIVLWEMLTRRVPFHDKNYENTYNHVVTCNWRLPIPHDTPQKLSNLIQKCWSRNPDDRPDFKTIVSMFEQEGILFPKSEEIDFKKLSREHHCPPVNFEYAKRVLSNPKNKNFNAIVKFYSKNIDNKLIEEFRREKLQNRIIQEKPTRENTGEILVLLSKLLKNEEFREFLDNGGQNLFEEALEYEKSINFAIHFARAIPSEYLDSIYPTIDKIFKLMNTEDRYRQRNILVLLCRIPRNRLEGYYIELSRFLKDIVEDWLKNEYSEQRGADHNISFSDEDFTALAEAVQSLFIDMLDKKLGSSKGIIENLKPGLNSFLELIHRGYIIDRKYAEKVLEFGCSPLAMLHILESFIRFPLSELNDVLASLLIEADDQFFDDLWSGYRDRLCDCLKNIFQENETTSTVSGLLLMFALSRYEKCARDIAKSEILAVFFTIDPIHDIMKLHILNNLLSFDFFYNETNERENILSILATDLMDERYRKYSLKLLHTMSLHKSSCLDLSKKSVFIPFIQLFLSSSIEETSLPYHILRNAAEHKIELPQVQVIISCLMRELLFKSDNTEVLYTLISIIEEFPDSVQEHDIRTIIIPQINEDNPRVTHSSLKLLSYCEEELIKNLSSDLLKAINTLLNTKNKLYPSIIESSIELVDKCFRMMEPGLVKTYLEGTGLIPFLVTVKSKLEANKVEAQKMDKYINLFSQRLS